MLKPKFFYLSAFLLALATLGLLGWWRLSGTTPAPAEQEQPTFSHNGAESPTVTPPSSAEAENTGQSLVVLSDQTQLNSFRAANHLSEADLKPVGGLANTYEVNRPQEALNTAGASVFPNRQYHAILTPDDPLYGQQWHHPKIASPAAWDITTGSTGVTIAVIDTGFALGHVDLVGKLTAAGTWRDFVCDDNIPQAGDADCDTNTNGNGVTHGTMTAGAAAATGNNSLVVAGMDWNAKILPLQALNDNGGGTTADVAAAVEYAKNQGVQVINLSLGSPGIDSFLRQEIDEAIAAGVTVVAAAGNCGDPANWFLQGNCDFQGQVLDPAAYPPVVAVGASNSSDERSSFSSYGSAVDLIAPGSGIITTSWELANPTTASASGSGTSFAAPIVAGNLGLVRAALSDISVSEINAILPRAVDKVSQMSGAERTNQHGYGRLQAWKAVKLTSLTHPDGTLVRPDGSPHVYLLEGGQRRHVTSPEIFASQGFRWESVRVATISDMRLAQGANIYFREGSLLKGSSHPIYIIDYAGTTPRKRHITDPAVFSALGFNGSEVINVADAGLVAANGPNVSSAATHPDGVLVRPTGSLNIYVIEDNQRRYIGNTDVFNSYGFNGGRVKSATSGDNSLGLGSDLFFREGSLIKDNNPPVYVIDYAAQIQKRHITSPAIFLLLGYTSVGTETYIVGTASLPATDGSPIN